MTARFSIFNVQLQCHGNRLYLQEIKENSLYVKKKTKNEN
jgi:hypothetical protein